MAVAGIALAATSCESFFDYEGDCDPHYYIKFEYDMNMEFADAFKEQVQSVNLWVFDRATGDCVKHIYSPVEDLAAYDYLLPLDVAPGDYNFVAWCGDIDNRHFTHQGAGVSRHEAATCRLTKRQTEAEEGSPNIGMSTSSEDLDLIFHGKLNDATCVTWSQLMAAKDAGQFTELKTGALKFDQFNCSYQWDKLDQQHKVVYTVPLIRDVNNITLTIQHKEGKMNTTYKRITMLDNNGSMLNDNSLDESDETIVYKPWALSVGTLEGESTGSNGVGDWFTESVPGSRGGVGDPSAEHDFMKIELSTGRMMANHDTKINIYDIETGNNILSFPVIKWLCQLRSAKYSTMSDQEYLDRKYDHELYVILDDDGRGGWTAISVVINGWHVIENGSVVL